MKLSDLYSNAVPVEQPAKPASGAADSAPKPAMRTTGAATAVSWVGLLLALVLLRVVYEVGE